MARRVESTGPARGTAPGSCDRSQVGRGGMVGLGASPGPDVTDAEGRPVHGAGLRFASHGETCRMVSGTPGFYIFKFPL